MAAAGRDDTPDVGAGRGDDAAGAGAEGGAGALAAVGAEQLLAVVVGGVGLGPVVGMSVSLTLVPRSVHSQRRLHDGRGRLRAAEGGEGGDGGDGGAGGGAAAGVGGGGHVHHGWWWLRAVVVAAGGACFLRLSSS